MMSSTRCTVASLLFSAFTALACDDASQPPGSTTGAGGDGTGPGAGGGSSAGTGSSSSVAGAGTADSASSAGAGAGGAGGAGSAGGAGGAGGTAGGTAAAGATGNGGSAGGPPPDEEAFTLLFRDDFDRLDAARWQLMTHSWTENLALFSRSAATIERGQLVLRLTPAPQGTTDSSGAAKTFLGAEVRSVDALTYGRVRARVKLARGSAVVSSLVTIYTPWPADNWNELDIECLGAKPNDVQFNAMVYTGAPVRPPVTQSVSPTQHPQKVDLGFDPSADFHTYQIEWTPSGARFSVDDVLRHEWTERIDLMVLPQNVLMTIWASSSAAWAGAVTAETGTASATYDWIELYRYTP
ncbi:glycoside hydrolase family 16 protein [Sorangium sp. So ce327]|uniref:glycoside hydrolase family 16 protein n=1 Tax=Sorangium sp. So ce327 TaxID=3133301 RepID=UPI003F617BBE